MPKGVYSSEKRRKPVSVEERFWLYVDKKNDEYCWNWTGLKNKTGYGSIKTRDENGKNKMIRSHRLSWIFKNGKIPEGMCILHSCDNPSCVNPKHLFIGTMKDNVQDMVEKGRAFLKTGSSLAAKLNECQVFEIFHSKEKRSDIAKKYGIHIKTVSGIKCKRIWRGLLCQVPTLG